MNGFPRVMESGFVEITTQSFAFAQVHTESGIVDMINRAS